MSRKPNTRRRNNSKKTDEEKVDDPKSTLRYSKGKGTKPGNDPSWYAADPVLLRDAASYPFSYNTGATEIHDLSLYSDADFINKPAEQISGICSLHVFPNIGTSINATDPINVAAQSVYSFVRHANSGHSNYDPADLMMYILAMANMYSYLVFCQRAYGYALTYDQRNRYIPNDLLRTNNINASDLVNNLANFRFWINTLIAKMVSFAVPATMSIFSRMSFMYSDFYIEGTSIKDQVYQYVPDGFYKFGIDSSSLGELAWKPFDYSTLMTTQDLIDYGNDLFDAIWSQEDFGIMSGDILKAYGDRIIKLTPIPEYYYLVPKFDAMVLTQMKNADMVRIDPSRISQDPTTGNILQVTVPLGFTTSDKYYGTTYPLNSSEVILANKILNATIKDYRILTVDTDNPTPEIVIEATRLKVAYDAYKAWYKCGTELISKVYVTVAPSSDVIIDPIILTFHGTNVDQAAVTPLNKMDEAIHNFHYMPRVWVGSIDSSTSKLNVYQLFDIDNFTLLTYEDVRKLHEAATVNMFAVPSIGKIG